MEEGLPLTPSRPSPLISFICSTVMNAENTLALVFSISCWSACSTPSRISVRGPRISSTDPNSLETAQSGEGGGTHLTERPHTARSPQDARGAARLSSEVCFCPKTRGGAGEDGGRGCLSLPDSPFPLPEENKQQGARHGAEAEAVHGGRDEELRGDGTVSILGADAPGGWEHRTQAAAAPTLSLPAVHSRE